MKPTPQLRHVFVESVPEQMEERTLYVSVRFRTAMHLCMCGCGTQVVTPLSPTDWKLTFDGVSISLDPSIGNWSLPCRSHYWIRRNKTLWAESWSDERVAAGRTQDKRTKEQFYNEQKSLRGPPPVEAKPGRWERFKRVVSNLLQSL